MSILDGARIEIDDMQDDYIKICELVLSHGDRVSPRGQGTHEVLGSTIVHHQPWNSLTQHIGRGSSSALAALEALQLIAGESYPELMVKVAPNTARFLSPDGGFHGAYGPRVGPWMEEIVRRLRTDPDTRQAVVNIWDSRDDGRDASYVDLPCTLNLHFMIRRDALDLHVTMRSNDCFWGITYDIFMFTQLQLHVAAVLGVGYGKYFHHANSLHVYDRDREKIEDLRPADVHADVPLVRGGAEWAMTRDRARSIILHPENGADRDGGAWWRKQAMTWAGTGTGTGDSELV